MAIAFVRAIPAAGTLGVNATSITQAYDATGCDCLVVGSSLGTTSGNITSASITVQTFDGVAMTTLEAFVPNAGSNTGGAALLGILLPNTGSKNVILTYNNASAAPQIALCVAGYSGVASFGNVGTNNPSGSTANSPTCNVTAAVGNLAVGIGAHGDTITGAGASCTLRGVANNYSTATSAGCLALVDRAGVGGATGINVASSISDHWTMHAVELVAAVTAASDVPRGRRNLVGLKIR